MGEEKRVVRAKSATIDEERIPEVTVRGRGRVGRMMEYVAKLYEQKHLDAEGNPQRKVRWAYHPIHRPDLSSLAERRMDGWRPVKVSDFDKDELGDLLGIEEEDAHVRTGDVILVWTSLDNQKTLQKENDDRAREQMSRVQEDYFQETESISARRGDEEHRVSPRGRAMIEERELDVDYEQRSD